MAIQPARFPETVEGYGLWVMRFLIILSGIPFERVVFVCPTTILLFQPTAMVTFQKSQQPHLLVALGIIYGDIGTSPLYVFKAIVGERPISNLLVYGGISCVFWTLTLQTTFKYIILTLQADNKGEGGIFSLFALVRRFGKKAYFPAIIGAATLLADGIITPPISVASAIEGLNGVPGLENLIVPGNNLTVGIVIGIISLLFFFQRFGTKIIGSSFGPIMMVWFSMILVLGLIPIIHNPAILAALSPHYGIELINDVSKRILVTGCRISLYYRC